MDQASKVAMGDSVGSGADGWRVRYVATGETDPETVVELLGCALAKCGYPEDATEAVVDAIWSHDVSTLRRSSHALLTFSRAGADRIT